MEVCSAEGGTCGDAVVPGLPVALCAHHARVVHDWVALDAGVLDVLPSPCLLCGGRTGVRYPSGWLCADCDWRVGDIPDDTLPPPIVEVVYYLAWRDRVKIGTSRNPRQRIAALPHEQLLAFERGGRALERRRHEQFAADRFPGSEWFRRTSALENHLAAVIAECPDPWAQHTRWLSAALALR